MLAAIESAPDPEPRALKTSDGPEQSCTLNIQNNNLSRRRTALGLIRSIGSGQMPRARWQPRAIVGWSRRLAKRRATWHCAEQLGEGLLTVRAGTGCTQRFADRSERRIAVGPSLSGAVVGAVPCRDGPASSDGRCEPRWPVSGDGAASSAIAAPPATIHRGWQEMRRPRSSQCHTHDRHPGQFVSGGQARLVDGMGDLPCQRAKQGMISSGVAIAAGILGLLDCALRAKRCPTLRPAAGCHPGYFRSGFRDPGCVRR